MAASETENHHSIFSNNNVYPSFPHFFEEISAVLNHGSISFGRYADDSSAWDKRSVFTNNRCQEELEKCKSPGSVAQKKAYFDEFYKNRVLKELPAHQQETNQYGPTQEEEENAKLKEDKLSIVSQIQISDNQGILKHKKPSCQEVKRCSTDNNDATIKKRMKVKQIIDEVEYSFDEASVSHPPLPEGNPRCVEQNSTASSKVKQTNNKTIKHGNVMKVKGTVASAITNKAKVHSITTKDVMKSKPTPLRQQASVKVNKSVPSMKQSTPNAVRNSVKVNKSDPSMKESTQNVVRKSVEVNKSNPPMKESTPNAVRNSVKVNKSDHSMKESTPNSVRNISRKTTEPHSGLTRMSGLSKSGSLVSSSSSSSIRKTEAKPCLKRTKQETELPVPSPQVTKLMSSAFSSSIKKAKANPSSNLQQSITKLETRSPLRSRSSKSASKNIAITDGLKNKAHCRRGSSDSSGHCMRPGGEESMDSRPKVISRSHLAQNKTNHGIGVEQKRSYNKEREEKERKDKVQAGLKRDVKHAPTRLSCTNKASVRKLVDKVVPLESADLKCDRAAQKDGESVSGQKRPIWR